MNLKWRWRFRVQGLLSLTLRVIPKWVQRDSAFGFVRTRNELVWIECFQNIIRWTMSILRDMTYKGNRNLKPHQPGMAKIGEVQQSFVGSPHLRVRFPLSRCSFLFRLSGWLVAPTMWWSCLGLSSKGWFRSSIAGELGWLLGTLI